MPCHMYTVHNYCQKYGSNKRHMRPCNGRGLKEKKFFSPLQIVIQFGRFMRIDIGNILTSHSQYDMTITMPITLALR